MTQIKERAPGRFCRVDRAEAAGLGDPKPDARLKSLLAERRRLANELAALDLEIERLRRGAALDQEKRERAAGPRLRQFALRGADVARRRVAAPSGVDEADLAATLERVVVAIRRGREKLAMLELLVHFDRDTGQVVAVESRRRGEQEWISQLRRHAEPGEIEPEA